MEPLDTLPPRPSPRTFVQRLGDLFRADWVAYGFALTVTYCASQLQQALNLSSVLQIQVLQAHAQVELRGFVLFLVAVVLSAYVGGMGPALISTFLAAGLMKWSLISSSSGWYITGQGGRWRLVGFMVSGVLCGVLIERHHHRNRQRLASRRFRDATLAHIGDAVITTDEIGINTFLNQEAERLTGWKNYQAVGRQLGDVVKVINDVTREPEEDVVKAFLKSGAGAKLSGHTLLISRDGREIPIVESAAPIMHPDGTLEGFVCVFRDGSEGRKAEAELKKRLALQEQIAHIVGSSPAVIYSFRRRPDGTTCFPFASSEIEAILGQSSEILVTDGTLAFSRVHPDDLRHLLATIDDSERDLSVWQCAFRVSSAARGEIWLEGRSIPEREGDGSTLWYGFMNDITERKRSEQRLNLLYAALESAANAVALTDYSGEIIWVNAAFTKMTGYSAAEVVGQNPRILKSGAHPQSFYKEMWDTLQNGNFWSGEVVNKRKDGTLYTELMTITPVSDDRGVVTHFIAIKQDVTEQRMAEKAIFLNEERLRLAQHAADFGVFEVELPSGKWTWSPEMSRIFGLSSDSTAPSSDDVLRMCHPDDRLRLEEQLSFLATGKGLQVECRIVKPNGEVCWVEISGKTIDDGAGKPVRHLGVVRDVTERNQLEAQFRQAQKMEAVGRLAGGVAHDFNNILMIIIGYGDLLKEQLGSDEQLLRMIEEILKAADRAASLTHQLLAFGRKQILMPKVLDLNKVLAEMGKMLPRLIGEDIDLNLVLGSALGHVMADTSQLQQVVMNLVVNARDAMPGGGRLTIETANAELDETSAQISGIEPKSGSFVLLSVADTGVGMDQETRAHIFEPFFTTKEVDKGTGLGLSIVYGVVKQSGGFILVDSELGQGTTFKIYLPRIEARGTITSATKVDSESRRGSETILMVEDEQVVRQVISDFLRAQGYTVLEAPNPKDAIEIAQQQGDRIHVLITDITMPDMNGLELAKQLQAKRPEMIVLYISGYAAGTNAGDTTIDASMNFLQKPFVLDVLGSKLRDILER